MRLDRRYMWEALYVCFHIATGSDSAVANPFHRLAQIQRLEADGSSRWKVLLQLSDLGGCILVHFRLEGLLRQGKVGYGWNWRRSSRQTQKELVKRKGDFSREISPSLSDFLKIWFGFQITTFVIPKSFWTHERSPHFRHSSVITQVVRASLLPSVSSRLE
jgi:hypothetical protein